ncbi:MAG: hypothetical protein R3E90_15915 [Marinicella sp.]|nr:hypothetical protein [Xanthomonadales bacterium]
MNTLHLCHWQNLVHLEQHLGLLSENDSLLIFGTFSVDEQKKIIDVMQDFSTNWYLVNKDIDPNIANRHSPHEINHEQWLELIIQHNNSYAWK